ncbi:MAG: hypothetical protein K2Q19_00365 [Rhodocyclaceae bacterium]|nr:hypothetical protein [Rhodocyclaceae bacterium]
MKSKDLLVLGVIIVFVSTAQLGMTMYRDHTNERYADDVVKNARTGDIVMLSSEGCPYCAKARAWFAKHNVPIEECFIENDPVCADKFSRSMAYGTPVIIVKGKPITGFDVEAVSQVLSSGDKS